MSKTSPSGYALHCRPKLLATQPCTRIFSVDYWYISILTGCICYEL